MERAPEDKHPPSPEHGERVHINSIIIPADVEQPLSQHQLLPANLSDYRELVGGYIEGVELLSPRARMYLNEDGKVLSLPMNRRATLLLWMHNRSFRYRDIIVGDAFLVGSADERGKDTTVPDEYTWALFDARHFHFEVQLSGVEQWHRHERQFGEWKEAYEFALGWAVGPNDHQKPWIEDIRVVPEQ